MGIGTWFGNSLNGIVYLFIHLQVYSKVYLKKKSIKHKVFLFCVGDGSVGSSGAVFILLMLLEKGKPIIRLTQ